MRTEYYNGEGEMSSLGRADDGSAVFGATHFLFLHEVADEARHEPVHGVCVAPLVVNSAGVSKRVSKQVSSGFLRFS